MPRAGHDLLEKIFAHKRREVAERRERAPLRDLERLAHARPVPLDFVAALRGAHYRPALIAEIKRASPSRGALAPSLDPVELARTYQSSGAAAISVLTDEHFFQGSLDDLRAVASIEGHVPVLRKDFVCDPYQVFEARVAGADAILLIASYLEVALLCELKRVADELGMTCLMEVHDEAELERALGCEPALIGINNRDLRTFEVSLEVTRRLAPQVPSHIAVVAESGIFTAQHVAALAGLHRPDHAAAVDAILVGEALVTAADTSALASALASAGRRNCGRPALAPESAHTGTAP
jgi:indole-3-glycerol phosphate synthase